MSFRQIFYGVLMWSIFAYAMHRGGWAEKRAAAVIVIGSYFPLVWYWGKIPDYNHVRWDGVLVDLVWLVTFFAIVLRSSKFWPMWVCAMQGVTMMSHLVPVIHLDGWLYSRANALWSYVILAVIGVGVYQDRRQAGVNR